MSKKRKSPLPTLSKKPLDVEEVDGLTLYLGGTHGYKKVKLLPDGYQGYDNKKKLYTGCFDTAIEAAIALARKERDADLQGPYTDTALPLSRSPQVRPLTPHPPRPLVCSSLWLESQLRRLPRWPRISSSTRPTTTRRSSTRAV